ncbi:MAG: autotransporter outer membrane beta-barrel domain-containing protein [Sutterella wadsworthensis]
MNAKASNAVANTENVTITVTGGEINAANVDPITGYIQGEHSGVPNRDSHVHQVAKTLGKDGANVAILGGGVASGAGAESSTKDVKLLLNGGKVNDNVFAGGLATLGGKATVEKALVQVNGAEVTGNMYGGGVAGSYQNEAFYADYKTASSNVKETTISLINGSLNGDVYAGGFNIKDSTSSKSTVDTAVIEIGSDFKFLKADAVIDGSGAESATLNFVNGYDFSKAKASEVALLDLPAGIVIKGFDKLDSGDLVTGANYDMGDKTSVEVTGNYEFGEILNGAATKTMTVKEGGALAVQSAQALANNFVVEEGVLALGTTARTADARDALGKYDEKAGLYLSGTVDLASAKINVGNVAADVTTNVNLGSNGTLIVDATAPHEDAAATTVTGTINAVEGSTLHYVNVADQGIVTVDVDGKVKTTVDNLLFKVVEVGDGQNKFTFERATGSDLAGTGLGGFDGDALVGMAENEVIGSLLDEANTAITSGNQREARLNGALNLAAAGGVQTAGIEAATMGIDQATKRAALTNVFLDGWTGFAEVTGTSLKMGGDSGALETKTELGGITVGGEYTMGDMTFGVMGNFGTGDVEGEGDNNGAKNDVDYYGVQGYTAKRMGQFNLVGQMGLMTTKNDVTSADGDSADIDATIFTIGARGEMAFQISKSCQAVPYVGLNYLRVATDGYNTAKGLSVDDMDQNLVSMPIGVAFSGNMDLASGWTLRPTVDVAYVHTFGDTDVEATTKFGAAAINTNLDVWSENVGRVGFGLEARKDALSFGGQIGGAFGDNDHREFYGQLNMKYLF